MNVSKIKAPALWATAFFGTLGILSVGYSAYVSSYPATATAGTSQLSATEWNKMVAALQSLDGKLSLLDFTNDTVGIGGTSAFPYKLNVSWNVAMNGTFAGRNGRSWATTGLLFVANEATNDGGGYMHIYGSNAVSGADDRRGGVDIGSSSINGNPGKINFTNYNGSGWMTNMTILPNGNVGIGNVAPSAKLEVSGGIRAQWGITWPSAANFHLDSTAGYGLYLNWSSGADVYARNTLLASSDERLKRDIVGLTGSLDRISKLNGVTYYWKNPESTQRKQVWVIAQQVEKLFPDLVSYDQDGMMAVNYQGFVGPLIESVKELKSQNEKQSEEIAELKRMNAELSETVRNLR